MPTPIGKGGPPHAAHSRFSPPASRGAPRLASCAHGRRRESAAGVRRRFPGVSPRLHPARAGLVPPAGAGRKACRAVDRAARADPHVPLLRPGGRGAHSPDAPVVRVGRRARPVHRGVRPARLHPPAGGDPVRRTCAERFRRRADEHGVLPDSRHDRRLVPGLGGGARSRPRDGPGRGVGRRSARSGQVRSARANADSRRKTSR